MSSVTINVPEHWPVYVAAVVTAVVGSAVVYVIRTLRETKKGKEVGNTATHLLLVFVSLLFTGLEYVVPFVRDHLVSLQQLHYVGSYVVGIYGAMNFLYALRLKSWFGVLFGWLSKQDENPPSLPEPTPLQPATTPDTNSDF